MTTAICVKCGTFKVGALTVCPTCNLDPSVDESVAAKSLAMSDHYRTVEQLRSASDALAAGDAITFDEQELKAINAGLGRLPAGPARMPLGCQVLVWLPVAAMLVLAGLVLWLYLRPK